MDRGLLLQIASNNSQHLAMGANSTDESMEDVPTGEQAPSISAALQRSQVDIEDEWGELARTLHDGMGGLLVGAILDVGWIAGQPGLPENYRARLERAQDLLKTAIDSKRELIEGFEAHAARQRCFVFDLAMASQNAATLQPSPSTSNLPALKQTLPPEVSIGVFRIFQEALTHVVANYRASMHL